MTILTTPSSPMAIIVPGTPSYPLFTLCTPRLLLRTKLVSDAQRQFEILDTIHFQEHSPGTYTLASAAKWIQICIDWFYARKGASWSVVERESGEIIGEVGMGSIREVEGKGRGGDAGIVLDERFCGKGYAVEALEASLSWCFGEEGEGGREGGGVQWIELGTSSLNAPMRGVLERVFGFAGTEVPMPASRAGGRINAIEVSYEFTKADWEKEGGARDRAKAWLERKRATVAEKQV